MEILLVGEAHLSLRRASMVEEKKYIIISQVRSGIGRDRSQKKTLIGLGLGKLNKMRKIEDTPAVRGMINKVKHLVDVEN